MFLVTAVPAVIQLVLSFSLPESPRYQLAKGKGADARRTIRLINPGLSADAIEETISRIESAMAKDRKAVQFQITASRPSLDSTSELFSSASASTSTLIDRLWRNLPTRRALIVACGLQFYQQATGFNSLMYYSGTLLQNAGFSHPPLFAMFIAVSNWSVSQMNMKRV